MIQSGSLVVVQTTCAAAVWSADSGNAVSRLPEEYRLQRSTKRIAVVCRNIKPYTNTEVQVIGWLNYTQ